MTAPDTNACESPDAAATRFAQELARLAEALDDAGFALRPGPLATAPVDTAITALRDLRRTNEVLQEAIARSVAILRTGAKWSP